MKRVDLKHQQFRIRRGRALPGPPSVQLEPSRVGRGPTPTKIDLIGRYFPFGWDMYWRVVVQS
jgi:hypothetical protein